MIQPKAIGLLIKPDVLEETDDVLKRAKAIGLAIQSDELKREQASVDTGTVVVVGADAFKAYGTTPWCAVGDHIAFARFAGKSVVDPETKEKFLVINDEDVVCVLKEGK